MEQAAVQLALAVAAGRAQTEQLGRVQISDQICSEKLGLKILHHQLLVVPLASLPWVLTHYRPLGLDVSALHPGLENVPSRFHVVALLQPPS